jgi:hypothetical protein
MAKNWNAALNSARGQIIGLLMDDDWLLPGFVASATSRFTADDQLGMVFTNHYFQRGTRLYERRCTLREGRYDDFLFLLLAHKPVAVSAALMRREVWQQVRPLPDLLTADVVMHVRAALAGCSFYYLAQPLMAYRVHPGQLTSTGRFRDDYVRAWEMFEFPDPACEAMRRRELARALASRAASSLMESEPGSAEADLTRAASIDASGMGLQEWIIRYIARRPALRRAVLAGWKRFAAVRKFVRGDSIPDNWASAPARSRSLSR